MKFKLPLTDSMTRLLPVAAALLLGFSTTSCKTLNSGGDPQYTSASGDGGYNPYPGQPGYQQYQAPTPSVQQPSYQTYTPPPQPAPTPSPEPDYTPSPAPSHRPAKRPASSSSSHGRSSYTVRPGDTLYRIARNHDVTVSRLKSANGLTSDLIRPGQHLSIP